MITKILYYHDLEIKNYMIKTLGLIEHIRSAYYDEFEIINCVTKKLSNDMGNYLGEHWGSADIIIIGQDNVPTIKMLRELVKCFSSLCVNPCISYPASTDLNRPMLNQINFHGIMYEANDRPKFAFYGGTGVAKIERTYQIRHQIDNFDWGFPAFDSHLKDLGLVDWHCHYPIHEHTKTDLSMRHWV